MRADISNTCLPSWDKSVPAQRRECTILGLGQIKGMRRYDQQWFTLCERPGRTPASSGVDRWPMEQAGAPLRSDQNQILYFGKARQTFKKSIVKRSLFV